MTQRSAASAAAAPPKTSTKACAALAQRSRAAGLCICSRAQRINRGASTTIATPARISPVKASIWRGQAPKQSNPLRFRGLGVMLRRD